MTHDANLETWSLMFLPTSCSLPVCLLSRWSGAMGTWHHGLTVALRIVVMSPCSSGCSLRELFISSARPQWMRNWSSHLHCRTEIKMFSVSWVTFHFMSPQPRWFQLICECLLTSYCTWPLLSSPSLLLLRLHPSTDSLRTFVFSTTPLGCWLISLFYCWTFPKSHPQLLSCLTFRNPYGCSIYLLLPPRYSLLLQFFASPP